MSIERPIERLPMSDINAKVYNVRGVIDPKDCIDLAKRIREEGLQNPVQVEAIGESDRAENEGLPYRLIAGFRRFMAHRINREEFIECRLYESVSPYEAAIINFTENTARQNLTLMQEARGLQHIRKMRSMTLAELAAMVGMSSKWVQIRLWATDLEPVIQKDIEDGFLKTQHIEQLKSLPQGEPRFAYVRQVKSSQLTNEKPRKSLAKKNVFSKKVRGRPEIFEMQDHIIAALGSGSLNKLPEEARQLVQFLGWVAGEATDIEVYGTLRQIAERNGLHYEVPEIALQSLQG